MITDGRETIIVGDFNLPATRKSFVTTNIISKGFKQMVTQPTHHSGSSIDHVYITDGLSCNIEGNWLYWTDHLGLFLSVN